MEFLVLAALGAGVGWAVSLFLKRDDGGEAWPHIAVGALGGLAAGTAIPWLANANARPGGSTDAPDVLLAIAGAATLIAVYRLLRRLMTPQ